MNATRTRSTSSKSSASKRRGNASSSRSGARATSSSQGASARKGAAGRKSTSSTGRKATTSTGRKGAASSSGKSAAKGAAGSVARTGGRGGRKGAAAKASKSTSARKGGTARRSASRANAAAGGGASRTPIGRAIEILKRDHAEAKKMFRQGERAKDDPEALREIVEACCQALTVHAEIEEQHFYPQLREALRETELIAEAEVEHATAKQLIAQLEGGDPSDESYAACFKVLGEYIQHHAKEEENEIFPKARRARADFQSLLDALQARDQEERQGAAGGAEADAAEAPRGRAARGRQGRGRQSPTAAGRGVDESMSRDGGAPDEDSEAEAGSEQAVGESVEGDVEQPRRGRRSSQLDTGETEGSMRSRDEQAGEQSTRRSRSGER